MMRVQFVAIYGGFMLGVRSVSGLAFYDWETTELVRRIEITPKCVSHHISLQNYILEHYFPSNYCCERSFSENQHYKI